jgi:hypothetical protein
MASTDWFVRLKNWQQLHSITFTSELAGTCALAAEQFLGLLEKYQAARKRVWY